MIMLIDDTLRRQIIYVILCYFIGFLGIHRFYVGKIGTGILYMFTIGLFGIGVIVDLVIGLIRIVNYVSEQQK